MIYVLSDVHGDERRFDMILDQINLRPEDTLYILGDIIDRGSNGGRILRRIMKMQNVKMLLGNHEYMMLQALGYPYGKINEDVGVVNKRALDLWYYNGGESTHNYLKRISKSLRKEILDYVQNLPLSYSVEVNGQNYLLVHAVPVDEYDGDNGYTCVAEFTVWKRYREPNYAHRSEIVVFGHTPTYYFQNDMPMKPWKGEKCLGIDCGCAFATSRSQKIGGRLACICLNDGAETYA